MPEEHDDDYNNDARLEDGDGDDCNNDARLGVRGW